MILLQQQHYKKSVLLFLALIIPAFSSTAQVVIRVQDSTNGNPVPFATVSHEASGSARLLNARGTAKLSREGVWIIQHAAFKTDTLDVRLSEESDTLVFFLKEKISPIEPVTVNAFLQNRTLQDVPGSLTVLSGKVLRSNNDYSPALLLNQSPGVYMHEGGAGTSRITIRGVGSRSPYSTSRIKAYLGEIPLTNGSGETSIEDIDMRLLESVDILRGPAGVPYGAGLAGVIRLAPALDQTTSYIAHNFISGSYQMLRNISHINLAKDEAAFSLHVHDTRREGYRENSSFYRSGLLLNGQFTYPSSNWSISPLLMYTNLKSYIPSSINESTYKTTPEAAAESWKRTRGNEDYQKIITGTTVSYQEDTTFLVKGTFFVNFRVADEVRPFNILSENNQMTGFRGHVSRSFAAESSEISLSAGLEAFYEWYTYQTYENISGVGNQGILNSNNKETRTYTNYFLQGEWTWQKLNITGGLNLNSTSYRYQDLYARDTVDLSGNYTYDPVFSPRMVVNYRINNRNYIYGVVSHGFSPPSLAETLTPEGQVNPDIKPETGWNYEIGFRAYPAQPALKFDVNLYAMLVENLLVAQRVGPDAFIGRNAGETSHTGIELSAEWFISSLSFLNRNIPSLTMNLFTAYNHTWHYFSDFVSEGTDYSGNRLTGSPLNTVNAGIYTNYKGLFANILVNYTGEMPMRDDNSLFSEPYTFTNFKIGYQQVLFQNISLRGSLGINNLFDAKYAGMILVNAPSFGGNEPRYYYPGLPRHYYFSLTSSYIF